MADKKHSQRIRDIADAYAKSKGLKIDHEHTVPLNPERSKRIAQAFHELKHEPENPKVKKAYKALIDETLSQYQSLKKSGLKVTPITPDMKNPYASSNDMIKDVRENNHLYFYPTDLGFGSKDDKTSDHPLLQPTKETAGKHKMVANDVFRVVHDYYGHAKEGTTFGPKGEEGAWQHHMKMYSPEAQKALTTETRGQNSWVNFGPQGEANRANPENTQYAEQKAGLLPDWAMETEERKKFADGGMAGKPPGFISDADFGAMNGAQSEDEHTPTAKSLTGQPSNDMSGFIPDSQFESQDQAYGGTGQTLGAAAEGALRGTLGPLAPAAEKLFGVPYKEQRERQAAHPIATGAGEIAGLGAGFLTGTGEAGLVSKIGEGAEAMAGLGEASRMAKIGSSAVRNAAEMAVLQGNDDVAKHIMKDPQAASESALANVGLAAAIGAGGGAFTAGVLSPLWAATIGPKMEQGLKALTGHLGGVEGQALKSTAEELEAKTGVEMPPAAKAVVNEKPGAMESHSILSQDDASMAGRSHQKTMNEYESNLAAKTVESLGRSPESIQSLPDLDKYNVGRAQGEQLHSELSEMAKPTIDGYNEFTNKYKNSELNQARKQAIIENIGQKTLDQGWHRANDSAAYDMATGVIKDLEGPQTITDVKKYITNLRDSNPYGSEGYQAAKQINKTLQEGLENAISDSISAKGGNADMIAKEISDYGNLRKNYAGMMNHFDNLNEYLKVGKYDGPESFLDALKNMSVKRGERVAERLSGKNSANALEILKQTPATLDKVKQYHVDKLLADAVAKAPAGKSINTRYIADTINDAQKMSPQIRDLIMSPEQQATVQSIDQVMNALSDPNHNFSNTARTIGKQAKGNISPISLIAMLMGHGDAGILSWLGSLGFSEAKPAMKLSMLKFLGSDAPVKAEGFKSMANLINHSYKGGESLTKASKALFQPGLKILNESQMPTAHELQHLDKLVAKNQSDPNSTLANAQNQHIGHYMPEHQQALTQAQIQASQYLSNLKPKPYRPSPLDPAIQPTKAQEARYNRALTIAQNPLVVLQHVKDGTLQVSDLQDLKAMYPKYASLVTQEVSNEMVNRQSEGEPIPYKTKISISLLLGQPLETSMQPSSIVAAQPKPKAPQQPQGGEKPKGAKKGTSTLGKSNSSYKTPNQAAESDRSDRD